MTAKPGNALLSILMICFAWYLGHLLLFRWQPYPLGISTDTRYYFDVAANVRAGAGLVRTSGEADNHYAPLYPLLLAMFGDNHIGAWIIGRAAFYLTIPALFAAIFMYSRSTGFALLGVGLFVVSPAAEIIYRYAWTEPVYLCLTALGLGVLGVYQDRRHAGLLALAGLLIGAAFAARLAGVVQVVLITGILLIAERSVRRASLFLVCAAGPMALWFGRNLLVTGAATDRSIGTYTLPPDKLNAWVLWLLIALIPALVGLIAYRAGRLDKPLGMFFAFYPAAYTLFIGLTILIADPTTPIDARIMAPMYFLGLPATAWAVAGLPETWRRLAALEVGTARADNTRSVRV